MDRSAPVKAGAMVAFTLTLKDGTAVDFSAVAKPFAGGNESYDPGMDMGTPTPSHG
jgi:copper(I)-binding protein